MKVESRELHVPCKPLYEIFSEADPVMLLMFALVVFSFDVSEVEVEVSICQGNAETLVMDVFLLHEQLYGTSLDVDEVEAIVVVATTSDEDEW